MKYVVYQGHKANIVGRTENLEDIPKIIRDDVSKRWTGSVEINVGEEVVTVGINKAIAIHYQITKVAVGAPAQGQIR